MVYLQEASSPLSQKDLERLNNQNQIITHVYEEISLRNKQPVETDETVMALTDSTGAIH